MEERSNLSLAYYQRADVLTWDVVIRSRKWVGNVTYKTIKNAQVFLLV